MNYNNSDIDWGKVNEVISLANKIFLTTHENPDGDGLGSEVALFHHLDELGKDIKIINYSQTPEMLDFLNVNNCIETFEESDHLEWIKTADLAIVFDVGDFRRTRHIKNLIGFDARDIEGVDYIGNYDDMEAKGIIKPNSVDVMICHGSLHTGRRDEVEQNVKKCASWLKPGGLMLVRAKCNFNCGG